MVSLGADLCIAVSRDIKRSRGTADCSRKAIRAGIPTILVDNDEGDWRELKTEDF